MRLDRRVTAQDESPRAIADTTVEIKDLVDEHTTALAKHGQQLGEIRRKLAQVEQQMVDGWTAEILRRLDAC